MCVCLVVRYMLRMVFVSFIRAGVRVGRTSCSPSIANGMPWYWFFMYWNQLVFYNIFFWNYIYAKCNHLGNAICVQHKMHMHVLSFSVFRMALIWYIFGPLQNTLYYIPSDWYWFIFGKLNQHETIFMAINEWSCYWVEVASFRGTGIFRRKGNNQKMFVHALLNRSRQKLN